MLKTEWKLLKTVCFFNINGGSLFLDEKGHLDVDEWLSQEFMFQIPTVLLCSADCAGLCPVCGKKKAECTCQPTEQAEAPVDTRLAILKSLLNR